ncbi:MAG TPA: tellurite resistance/C4-dicarboxylate transporter family protein [Nitrolancea sp.]|nr:tellurite resistance/C4-dicarboxylate transporter family protein [Nitrolancea sp.]
MPLARPGRLRQLLSSAIAELHPGYFALVMATGIVAIALRQQGFRPLDRWMFAVNLVAYPGLWLLTLARLLRARERVRADLLNPLRAPGFLTTVAATSVLGRQFVLMTDDTRVAFVLWLLSAALWLVLLYAFFAAMMLREHQPHAEQGLHGGWLLSVVATQSVALLGARVAERVTDWRETMLFWMLVLYLLGCLLYLLIGGLLLFRLLFLRPDPAALFPLYWITMGAAAITVLTGSTLIEGAPEWPFLASLRPFLAGLTLLFWACASWWIPLLVILGAWRHLVKRYPLVYEPQFWGLVFPLGMYTVASFETAAVLDVPALLGVAHIFVLVALAAWVAVFAGMAHRVAGTLWLAFAPRRDALATEEP